jgi:hypothetical protein
MKGKDDMRKLVGLLLLSCVPSLMGGCISLFTTVDLVNDTASPVHVTLYYGYVTQYSGGDPSVEVNALAASGQKKEFDIQPGQTAAFSDDCAVVRAIAIQQAEISVAGGAGPTGSTGVYREGTDYTHGDTLTFTFSGPSDGTGLDIAFQAQSPPF